MRWSAPQQFTLRSPRSAASTILARPQASSHSTTGQLEHLLEQVTTAVSILGNAPAGRWSCQTACRWSGWGGPPAAARARGAAQ